MQILPAIDLLEGRCVRLVQGRYDRVIQYQRDPVEVARDFMDQGVNWLHVIDLDGARAGQLANLAALEKIAALGAQIQFGGGIRETATIDEALAAGAERVIVGTRALEDPDWFRETVHADAYRQRVVLGLDARLGRVAVRGWTEHTTRSAAEVADIVADWPLAALCYTDIGRDGTLLGPNLQAIRDLASLSALPVIACGGVSDLEDLRHLANLDLAGIVIGRALYEKRLKLADAFAIVGHK